jgi:hypothetical protein
MSHSPRPTYNSKQQRSSRLLLPTFPRTPDPAETSPSTQQHSHSPQTQQIPTRTSPLYTHCAPKKRLGKHTSVPMPQTLATPLRLHTLASPNRGHRVPLQPPPPTTIRLAVGLSIPHQRSPWPQQVELRTHAHAATQLRKHRWLCRNTSMIRIV